MTGWDLPELVIWDLEHALLDGAHPDPDSSPIRTGVRDLVAALARRGVRQTVGAAARRGEADRCLERCALAGFFETDIAAYGPDATDRDARADLVLGAAGAKDGLALDRRRVWLIGPAPQEPDRAALECLPLSAGRDPAAGGPQVDLSDTAGLLRRMSTPADPPPSFEDLLRAWGPDAAAGPPRPGTHTHEVRSVTVNGVDCVGRRSTRSAASLHWEHALLRHLAAHGVPVPPIVPTRDGRDHHRGLTLTRKVPGGHPDSADDWRSVVSVLRLVHTLTRDWPQRPGAVWISPPSAAADRPHSRAVVVGRTRRRDITMTAAGPVFVDWDESRVDWPVLDFLGAEHDGPSGPSASDLECARTLAQERERVMEGGDEA
jgi:hypothetical protein